MFANPLFAGDTPFAPDLLYHSLEPGVTHIYLANSATGESRPLLQTADKGFEYIDAEWSPDGRQIAFVLNQQGKFEIFVCDVDGGNLRQLTRQSGSNGQPTWSPDSSQIAFIQTHQDGQAGISVVSARGGPVKELVKTKGGLNNPGWSPDGTHIVVSLATSSGSDIWTIRSDASSPTNLTATPKTREVQPTWSPDGRKLAFVEYASSASNIRVMDMKTRKIAKITDDSYQNTFPVWTPGGTALLFQSTRSDGVRTDIYRVPANGGTPENLTANPSEDQDQSISTLGDKLVFTSFLSGKGQIYWIDLNTKAVHRISHGESMAYAPSWRPVAASKPPQSGPANKPENRSSPKAS